MVLGGDFSHHNDGINIAGSGMDLVILKATEGKTMVDKKFPNFFAQCGYMDNVPFIGAYHYARPENNTAVEEARHFVERVAPYKGTGILCALDWEDKALQYSADWAIEWLEYVEEKMRTIPFFYIQASSVKKFMKVAEKYPLWVACYSQDSRSGKYKNECERAVMIQITSHPYDIDVYKGTRVELANYIVGIRR